MSLYRALVGSRINETIDNYTRVEQLLAPPPPAAALPPGVLSYDSDSAFWTAILADRQLYVNKKFALRGVNMSEWVPRVPGLAHQPEWHRLRYLGVEQGQRPMGPMELDGLQVFQPQEKSMHVMSGIGTLRLPPNANGDWLFSITAHNQASEGTPVLVTADAWDRIQKNNSCECRTISCTARWQPMAMEWSKHFRATGSIPPGYFVLNDPDAITVEDNRPRLWACPFTIMEYESGANELFDYVYCASHTDSPQFRHGIISFFEKYRLSFGGATSRYLVAGDLVDELWQAVYHSPADLLAQDSSAQSQLELLMARINDCMLGKDVTDELLVKMGAVMTEDELVRLSGEIGIDARGWRRSNATVAEQCSQFLAAVIAKSQQDALLERLALSRPGVLS